MSSVLEQYDPRMPQGSNSPMLSRGSKTAGKVNSHAGPKLDVASLAAPLSPTSGSRASRASNSYTTVASPQGQVAFRNGAPVRSASPWNSAKSSTATPVTATASATAVAWQSKGSNSDPFCFAQADAEVESRPQAIGGTQEFSRQATVRNATGLQAWLSAARTFELNADFDASGALSGWHPSLEDLSGTLKAASANKWTTQTLGDKLALHRILRNLRVPQMPVHFISEGATVNRADVDTFVLTHLCGPTSSPVAMKPTHLSNGTGVIFVGRVAQEDGPQPTINYLVHHLQKFLAQKAAASENSLLRSLRPGFIAQGKYDSVPGFDRPLEVRLLMLWGKAKLATWWWGQGDELAGNVWLTRQLATPGEFSSSDSWGILHGYPTGDPVLELMQQQLPGMVAVAEGVAAALGAPFLRTDFFVGSERWGVRLNDIVYSSAGDYFRSMGDDLNIVQILQEGHAQCPRHFPPEYFLAKLGVQGHSYSDMIVVETESATSVEDTLSANTVVKPKLWGTQMSMRIQDMGGDQVNTEAATLALGWQSGPSVGSTSSKAKFKFGDEAEIWSKSQKVWSRGKIIKVGSSTVTVSFTLPDGNLYAKELPPGHQDLRPAPVQPPAANTAATAWNVGDEIEVWSNSRRTWGRGQIEKVSTPDGGDIVVLARFTMPDGSVCEKELWGKCAELRHASSSNTATPPAPSVPAAPAQPTTPTGLSSPDLGPRKRTLTTDVVVQETRRRERAKTEGAQVTTVHRTPSYTLMPGSGQYSAQNGVSAQVVTTQNCEPYAPPASSHLRNQESNRSTTTTPSTTTTAGVQRSYSYVPPVVDTPGTPHVASYVIRAANELAPPQSNPSHVSPSPTHSEPSQTNGRTNAAGKSPTHVAAAPPSSLKKSNYVQVQRRPASVPPQRAGAAQHTGNSFKPPAWAANGQQPYVRTAAAATNLSGPTAPSTPTNVAGVKAQLGPHKVITQNGGVSPSAMQGQNGGVSPSSTMHGQNGAGGSALRVEDLAIGQGAPDPTQSGLKSQLITRLGVSQGASVSKMGQCGGQNEGVWLLKDGSRSFVLKLVKNVSVCGLPTETDRFVKLAAEHPAMLSDSTLTFPMKIFRLKAAAATGSFDLMVMNTAPGERVSDVIALSWARKQKEKTMTIMEGAGACLKSFHQRYGNKQHCDFQASNLFYDEKSGKFTMVDLADIGQEAIIKENDYERFIGGLRILGKSFGQAFFQESQRAFQAGYNATRS